MIRVYEVFPGATDKDGDKYCKNIITSDTRFGGGDNFNFAFDAMVCSENKMCTAVKNILFNSYIQIYVGEDKVQLLLDWARTQFPELYV